MKAASKKLKGVRGINGAYRTNKKAKKLGPLVPEENCKGAVEKPNLGRKRDASGRIKRSSQKRYF